MDKVILRSFAFLLALGLANPALAQNCGPVSTCPSAGPLDGSELFYMVQGGRSTKVPASVFGPPQVVNAVGMGADPTCHQDAAPALRKMFALGSNHTFVIPPGCYLIASVMTSPYAGSTGSIGFGLFCPTTSPCSDIDVVAYGASFQTAASVANIDYSGFSFINRFRWFGGTFVANPANWPNLSEPTAMILFDISNFRFQDVATSGNWGGGDASQKHPVMFAVDSVSYGVFDHIVMPQQGECFDIAFLQHVTFENIQAVGAGDSSGASSSACISLEYDANTIALHPELIPIPYSYDITLTASNDISNFDSGVWIAAGSKIVVSGGHYHDNPGGGLWPIHGAGVGLYNSVASFDPSAFDPVHDVVISGADLSNNGSVSGSAGAGVVITASSQSSYSIAQISGSSSPYTVTATGVPKISAGTKFTVTGVTPSSLDGTYTVTSSSAGSFVATTAATGSWSSGGAASAGEQISNVLIGNNIFDNNYQTAVLATGPYVATGSVKLGANLLSGASQTALYTSTVQTLFSNPWTPTDVSGGANVFTSVSASYDIQGNYVLASFEIVYPNPVTGGGDNAEISGLPIVSANVEYGYDPEACTGPGSSTPVIARVVKGTNNVQFYNQASMAAITNSNLTGATVQCVVKYPIN